jgi:Tol biopolymer transport system component
MTQVWTMDTDGSDMRQETSPASGLHHYFPAWSPDSRYIYFVQYDDSTGFNYSALYRLDVESGTVTANAGRSFDNGNSVACYGNYIAYFDYGENYTKVFDIRTNADVFSTAESGFVISYFFL